MKKISILILGIFMFSAQAAFCLTDTVSPELEQSLKTHTNEPNFMTIIFALVVVISLIYLTGLIYSKLNIVGAKTVQAQLKNYDLSKVVVISTTQLGQGKNLHVIELNSQRYLIGATPNAISLIKELEEIPTVPPTKTKKAKVEKDLSADIPADAEPVEEFEVHKKYL